MEYVISLFGAIPLSTVIIFIAAASFLVYMGMRVYNWIVTFHDKHQEKEASLVDISTDVKDMKEEQKNINSAVKDIIKSQKQIIKRQDEIEAKTNKYRMSSLKDKLNQNYKYYTDTTKNPQLAWTDMERDAFDNLFIEYEELGGNGYMHSIVRPEMDKLEVVPMSNLPRITELMNSRRG